MTVKSIKIFNGKRISNKKGDIIKFVNKKSKFFNKFGEIYFSELKKQKIKGWNYHKKYTCLITVPFGKVEFKLLKDSSKKFKKYTISEKNNLILRVPPKTWFSFKSLVKKSIVANILDNIHNPSETKKSNKIKNIFIK